MLKTVDHADEHPPSKSLTWRLVAILILSLPATHAAFAQKVTMEFDQAADFTKYRTFAIRAGELNSKNRR
jgi:hypothetical protein